MWHCLPKTNIHDCSAEAVDTAVDKAVDKTVNKAVSKAIDKSVDKAEQAAKALRLSAAGHLAIKQLQT